jgi:hypothetical protein
MKIVSFYCDDSSKKYSKYAKRLIDNANSLGVGYHLEEKKPWVCKPQEVFKTQHFSNCKWKPYVIETALKETDTCLWLDVDCYVEKINHIPVDCDIGYFSNVPKYYSNKISVGWIWFNSTPNTFDFLKSWQKNLKTSPQDHNAFSKTHRKLKNQMNMIEVTDSVDVVHNKPLFQK